MTLDDVVQKYRALTGGFGRPIAIEAFGLPHEEIERLFSSFDEDYRISRFFHFTLDPALESSPANTYKINGFAQSHVSLALEIESIL